jgi:acyl carrier protein
MTIPGTAKPPDYDEVLDTVITFVEQTVLGGDGGEVDANTPLLEWNILDSMSIVQLIALLQNKYDLVIPVERIVGSSFKDADSIVRLVVNLG